MADTGGDGFETIDVEAAEPLSRDDSVTFVDVREPHEIEASGKIPGALTVPLGQLDAALDPASPAHAGALDPDRPVVFYCAAGGRSRKAAELALSHGYRDVSHVAGGFGAWRQAGKESEEA